LSNRTNRYGTDLEEDTTGLAGLTFENMTGLKPDPITENTQLAEKIDFSKVPGATDKFTPDFNFIEKNAPGVKNYKGTTKQDYINAVTSGAFGQTVGATSFDRNVGDLFEGVDLNKSGSMFSTTPTFVSHGAGSGTGYIDVDKSALQPSALEAANFFVEEKAKGGRAGYAKGGLAKILEL
jgi:hypothetical protein